MDKEALFLHGFMGSRRDWDPVFEEIDGVECHAVDLPGHGRSGELSDDRPANMEWMADRVLHHIDERFDEKIHLVGYSMGGRIALHLALHHPERFASVVLESASPGLGGEAARAARRKVDAERARQMVDGGLEVFLRRWYELAIFGELSTHPDFEAMLARRLAGDVHNYARVIREMSPGAQPDLWPRLDKLQIPSLWVAGGEDEKYVAIVDRAVKRAPDAEGQIVDGVGHNVHFMAPRQFGELIKRWLTNRPGRGAGS